MQSERAISWVEQRNSQDSSRLVGKGRAAESLGPCGDDSHTGFILIPFSSPLPLLNAVHARTVKQFRIFNLIHHRANVDSFRFITINTNLLCMMFNFVGAKALMCLHPWLPFFSVSLAETQRYAPTLLEGEVDGADKLRLKGKRIMASYNGDSSNNVLLSHSVWRRKPGVLLWFRQMKLGCADDNR